MKYLNRESNYDRFPTTIIKDYDECFLGYKEIVEKLNKLDSNIITIETYPGVNDEELINNLVKKLKVDRVIYSIDIFYDEDKLNELMYPYLTDDRVRGVMYDGDIDYFIDKEKLKEKKESIRKDERVLIYGFGASLINKGDVLIYVELSRWEIELRYRNGLTNYKCSNSSEDSLKKIKRGYFVEWRIGDKLKFSIFEDIDYYIDTNIVDKPKTISGNTLRNSLKYLVNKPFRLVPYFDPGVWGGQWMKEVFGLDEDKKNYAWSFDGVPEENSLMFKYGDLTIETPAMNLVKYQPLKLLGKKVYDIFGSEFPIRFDFLDTMEGQNLSLQVHPTKEYIKNKFNMPYTQDESYFILDAREDSGVYLGLKDGVDKDEFIEALKKGQETNEFDCEKYINKFKAKKFDHFLIPGGTIHCSASNTVVLEVSATPYNFTFKLWDWNRLGLDGLPRPIHIEDGEKVIDYARTTSWVKENLVNHFEVIHDDVDYKETRTGLHSSEFIETRVFETSNITIHNTDDRVNMLNLIDGKEATIESIHNEFEPFVVHYGETFIVPACVNQYIIRPLDKEIKFIKAYVR